MPFKVYCSRWDQYFTHFKFLIHAQPFLPSAILIVNVRSDPGSLEVME